MSSGGAAQTTGGIRLPEGPLSSPARRTELGDKADRGLLATVPCSLSLLGLGRYPPDQTRGRGLQDAGNLKGPGIFAGPLVLGSRCSLRLMGSSSREAIFDLLGGALY